MRRLHQTLLSDVMKQLASEGMTMMVVTHEMRFARQVGTWAILTESGRVAEEGGPARNV